jgi:cell division protein FtsI/penicillin-binding protein 2
MICTLLLAADGIFSQAMLQEKERIGFAVFFILFITLAVSLSFVDVVQTARKKEGKSNPSEPIQVETIEVSTTPTVKV